MLKCYCQNLDNLLLCVVNFHHDGPRKVEKGSGIEHV